MNIEKIRMGFAVLFLLSILIAVTGCAAKNTNKSVRGLGQVEVAQFEGKKLDSVSIFYDNSIKGSQFIDEEEYTLKITGKVDNPIELRYQEVIAHQRYQKVVTLHCVEGWDATILWEGILLKDLFREAGVQEKADTVIFYAYDGYSTSVPLDYILENDILLAYKMNNVTLSPERGFPFQLVAEEKWGYKWIKWITEIEVSDNSSYKGYWESYGYSQSGDLDKPKFES